jgi:DNA-binding response OmpR family regulator
LPAEIFNVHDGEQLMYELNNASTLPDILFLDLNMPRKNGLECLLEIKLLNKYDLLPIIIFSTSYEQSMVNLLYKNGANYYVRKPAEFSELKSVIQEVISLTIKGNISQPAKENFVLRGQLRNTLG